ncbi:MAG TPA: hypothetical protein VMU93_04965 [Caulobacteraceae bacterium]|nr:hypothetical protein [Caulobacteraceae bacterium]
MSQMNGREIADGSATTHHGLGPGIPDSRSASLIAAHQLAMLTRTMARREPTGPIRLNGASSSAATGG